jgi:hypothetical protein
LAGICPSYIQIKEHREGVKDMAMVETGKAVSCPLITG